MARVLMILEVSQKQAYIFGSRKLRDNIERSAEIRFVTSEKFFKQLCPECYSKENMVYSGGGHTVLQFDTLEAAKHFSECLTLCVLRDFPSMELFVKLLAYDEAKTPGENLNALVAGLEAKKARRAASFRRRTYGVEHPRQDEPNRRSYQIPQLEVGVPKGWTLTSDGEELAGEDSFLAVIHLDGNAMGARVQAIYDACRDNWDECVKQLDAFSKDIDDDFAVAYDRMTEELVKALEASGYQVRLDDEGKKILPVRKVVGAGDDVCFIAAGSLGLECAVSFLRHLSNIRHEGTEPYAACAGVVLIHRKYPFRQAYDLSEALCSNAKKFGAKLAEDGSVSAIDWHIEFGQLKGSLSQIRADYQTEDGGRMELRPLVVLPGNATVVPQARSYQFFAALSETLAKNPEGIVRSKQKQMRNAFRMGELETQLALRQTETGGLLWMGIETRFPDYIRRIQDGEKLRAAFFTDNSDPERPVRRCLYFDAIELTDHLTLWRGEKA